MHGDINAGGMYYRIGEGHKEYIPDKTVDEEFRLLTIAAICDECRNCGFYEGNIYLAVGCPTAMLTAQRESTREYFMSSPHIDCEYNNVHYHPISPKAQPHPNPLCALERSLLPTILD